MEADMTRPRDRSALSRRLFLGGSAVVVGLPFLESLVPKAVLAQSQSAAKRLLYWWIPNGVWMDSFRPTTTGAGYTMPPVLTALESLRSDFSIVTGLQNDPAKPDQIGDHASGTSGFRLSSDGGSMVSTARSTAEYDSPSNGRRPPNRASSGRRSAGRP